MSSNESGGRTTDLVEIIPARDGTGSIEEIAAVLESIGTASVSFEIVGRDSGVRYHVRSDSMSLVRQQLAFHLPGCEIRDVTADRDPLGLDGGEQAWSMPLGIDGEVGIPLRYVDDETEAQASLASLSGALTASQAGERVVSRVGGRRVKNNSWANRYQRHLDRDGQDRPEQETSWWRVAVVTWLIVVLGAALVGFISELDRDLETAALASVRFAAFPFIGGGLLLCLVWLMVRGKDFTPDAEDIERMRRKTRRHAYDAVVEIVVILPSGSRIERAEELADALIDAYRWYEVVGKRRFRSGRLRSVKAVDPAAIWKFGSNSTVLGAEEISALWHLPDAELLARSIDLAVPMIAGGEGALVGVTTGSDAGRPVHFPPRQFARHMFFLGQLRDGKIDLNATLNRVQTASEGRGQG